MALAVTVAFLALATFAHAHSTDDAYVDRPTGISFPAHIASLRRVDVVSFADRDPRLGVAVRYVAAPGCRCDVFVYDLGIAEIPSDPDDPILARQFQQALGDIRTHVRNGTYRDVRVERSGVERLGDADSPRIRQASLSYLERGQRKESHLYLTGYRSHFVKVRFTFAEQARDGCLAALGELSAWLSETLRK